MTKHKARKRLVRERAAKTGESYAAALRQLLVTKENAVTTPTEEDTPPSPRKPVPRRCIVCDSRDDPARTYRRCGHPICDRCDDAVHAAVREHLEPVAPVYNLPYEYLVLALVYEKVVDENPRVRIDLHTFAPGAVIGLRGVTAQAVRDAIVGVTGLHTLQLNIRQHDMLSRSCTPEPKPTP